MSRHSSNQIFVPKIKGVTGAGPQQQHAKPVSLSQVFDDTKSPAKSITGDTYKGEICSGNVCSTGPAQAMEQATGTRVVPGKAAKNVFPTDFLRSKEYDLIGSHVKTRRAASLLANKYTPLVTRGLLGAAGAGAIYGASEKPEVPGAAAGVLGASAGATALSRMYHPTRTIAERELPSLGTILNSVMTNDMPLHTDVAFKRWATRRLPLLAAGGAAGWYGTKKLMQYRKDSRNASAT